MRKKKNKVIFLPKDLKKDETGCHDAYLSCRIVERIPYSDKLNVESEIFDGTKFILEVRETDLVMGTEVKGKIRVWLRVILSGEQNGRASITLPYAEPRWGSRISVLTKLLTLQPPR
jgi:hypothetical protein